VGFFSSIALFVAIDSEVRFLEYTAHLMSTNAAVVLAIGLIISSILIGNGLTNVAKSIKENREIRLFTNGQPIDLKIDGRVGFSDALNPIKVQQMP